ncbi:tRNA-splicing endonuclease subunit Sen15 [Penicillium sp. DV-2018c]|nr:tRNA-splicing endonuclease subunit Sen15 [Penicillium sp. DV-2018c]KAJ5581840.1 tRNA-splicing endonuclease subunit Sen15 [Penicillium sp. DV-2018c]
MTDAQKQTSRPEASALTSHIADNSHEAPHLAAAAQVQHNLQYQHLWTSIVGYTISNETENTSTSAHNPQQPPQTPIALLSGYPPHRVYTHPDEQLYMLENGIREDDLEAERMFVVPLVQGQSWTLRHMAAVFDRLSEFERKVEEHDRSLESGRTKDESEEMGSELAEKLARYYKKKEQARLTKEWGSQRLLIAMVDKGMGGDGTVAYYVLHEGEVKPRQN